MSTSTTLAEFKAQLKADGATYLFKQAADMHGDCIHFFLTNGHVMKAGGHISTDGHHTVTGEVQESCWSETPWDDEADYHQSSIDRFRRHMKARAAVIQEWTTLHLEGRTPTLGLSLAEFGSQIQREMKRFNAARNRVAIKVADHQYCLALLIAVQS